MRPASWPLEGRWSNFTLDIPAKPESATHFRIFQKGPNKGGAITGEMSEAIGGKEPGKCRNHKVISGQTRREPWTCNLLMSPQLDYRQSYVAAWVYPDFSLPSSWPDCLRLNTPRQINTTICDRIITSAFMFLHLSGY